VTDHHHVFTHQSISRAILAAAADAIVASDRDGIIQFWNPGAERIFGYGAAQAIGRSLDLMIPERIPRQLANLAVVLMRIVAPVGQNQIRIDSWLQRLEPLLDRFALFGEKAVAKRHHFDLGPGGFREKVGRGFPGLVVADAAAA